MRPIVFTITGTGTQIIPLDWQANPASGRVSAVISATATYEVDATLDNPYTTTPAWAAVTPVIASGTTSTSGTWTAPLTALRLNVTASTGSVTFTVVQSGGTGAS